MYIDSMSYGLCVVFPRQAREGRDSDQLKYLVLKQHFNNLVIVYIAVSRLTETVLASTTGPVIAVLAVLVVILILSHVCRMRSKKPSADDNSKEQLVSFNLNLFLSLTLSFFRKGENCVDK